MCFLKWLIIENHWGRGLRGTLIFLWTQSTCCFIRLFMKTAYLHKFDIFRRLKGEPTGQVDYFLKYWPFIVDSVSLNLIHGLLRPFSAQHGSSLLTMRWSPSQLLVFLCLSGLLALNLKQMKLLSRCYKPCDEPVNSYKDNSWKISEGLFYVWS